MSSIKRGMEEAEEKRQSALEFAIVKGVLKRCQDHEECVFDGGGDLDDAYRAAAFEFKRGHHNEFTSQREFTDCLKSVVEDNSAADCPRCEKLRED
jgi:hypothetical protein